MRVRMLKTHEQSASHPEHGSLTLLFGTGSTQHFDEATATSLVSSKIAEAHPEDSQRVRMLRTITELELADRINAARERAGILARVAPTPGSEAHRYRKGELVHFPDEAVQALVDTAGDGGPAAELDRDPDYNPVASTLAEATDAAIARKREQLEAEARRAAIKAKTAEVTRAASAAAKSAGSGGPIKAATPPSVPAAPASPSSTSSTSSES